ncbi:formyltransferase family protein [Maridesulfovibrio sp.]|uniref:methionyl-tRNA formyltransferase n=1 Tax=Maridesulfovibrio sp. TaxID=2795000 RepID=UPI002AA77F04|nr:formyltransferase family protein [Maridesulfovibrio sp.]
MSIVFFVDEVGARVIENTRHRPQNYTIVYDPRRYENQPWLHVTGVHAIPHPPKNERQIFLEQLGSPQLGIICSYSRILWKELIDFFPMGVVNLHGGKLPEYRGANTLQWAIINGEKSTAATLHFVDKGVDTGPVIDAAEVVIETNDTMLSVLGKILNASVYLLDIWLPSLLQGKVPSYPQDESKAHVWPSRTPDDGLINWSQSDEEISLLIRALAAPWPGAFYYTNDNRKVVIDHALSPYEVAELRKKVAGE